MTFSKFPTPFTINLNFVQIRDLVLQMPDNERQLIYHLLKSEFENRDVEWVSKELLDSLPEDDNISEEELYESLKQL